MIKKLMTLRSGSKTIESPPETTPKREIDPRLKELLTPDIQLNESHNSGIPEHRHRNIKSPLNLEEFEKEVNVSERAKNFNFRFDNDEDDASSLNSQRIDMVEGDEQPNPKAIDVSAEQNASGNSGPGQNDKQEDAVRKSIGGKEEKPGERTSRAQESLATLVRKHGKSVETLDDPGDATYSERTFDESNDGLDAKYRDDAHYNQLKWIIFPDDRIKYMWDVIIALNLMYTATIVPYSVAFIDFPSDALTIIDTTSNVLWAIDILITFFSAYEDKEDNLVVSRKKIAFNYITGWFLLDFVSILPFDILFDLDKSFNALLRIAKLPKLTRFIRLAKLVRMLRFLKDGSKIARGLSDWLKFRPGMDRFFMTIAFFFMFCHLACCVWYMQANLNSDDDSNWVARNDLLDKDDFAHYISSFYFIIATVVTVGYGDIHAGNTLERLVAVFLMFLGAFFYSFIIGSLSSVILNLDSRHRDLEKKINTLIEIRQKYALDNVMFNKIKRALKFGYSRNEEDNIHFLNDLPLPLRTKLSVAMHKDLLKNIIFFKPKSDRFLATIGPLLKQMKIGINEYIFTEGEYANEMYFIKSGTVQMVIKEYNNFPFMYIEQGYYFGEVDLLFGETRKHSYQAKTECELLSLSKKNFTKVFFQDFPDVGAEIYNNALKRRVRAHKTYKDALTQCQSEAREKGKRKNSKFIPQVSHIPARIGNEGEDDDDIEQQMEKIQTPENEPNQAQDAVDDKQPSCEDRNNNHEDQSAPPIEKFPTNPSIQKVMESKADNPSVELHEHENHSISKMEHNEEASKLDVDNPIFPPKKKTFGKWSLLRNTFESKMGPLVPEKKEGSLLGIKDSLSFLHHEASPHANRDQLHILQQRVEQLEKSIEKILELYQSVIPREE